MCSSDRLNFVFSFDIQVAQKKKFNDTYKSSKNLLGGSEWYCQQAFRALNQAAGMCAFVTTFNTSKWNFLTGNLLLGVVHNNLIQLSEKVSLYDLCHYLSLLSTIVHFPFLLIDELNFLFVFFIFSFFLPLDWYSSGCQSHCCLVS